MTTGDSMKLEGALDPIRDEMTLPDGRKLGAVLPADPWIEEKLLVPILATAEEGLPQHPLVYMELARAYLAASDVLSAPSVAAAVPSPLRGQSSTRPPGIPAPGTPQRRRSAWALASSSEAPPGSVTP